MPPPTKTYTVTLADTHAHTDVNAGTAAASKPDAALCVLQEYQSRQPSSTISEADVLTITVTQP